MKRYVCTPLESHPTPFRSKLLTKHDNLRISPRLKSHNHFERKWWQTCQKMLTRQTWKKLLFLNQKYRYNWLNNRKLIYRTFYPRVSKNNNTAEITVSCPQCAETPATRQWNRIWLLLNLSEENPQLYVSVCAVNCISQWGFQLHCANLLVVPARWQHS